MNYIIRAVTLKRLHIVTHNYTPSFSIKTGFCETNISLFQQLNRFSEKH